MITSQPLLMEKQAYVLTVLRDGSPKGPSVCLFFSLILMEQDNRNPTL